jgi:hypothetical protein
MDRREKLVSVPGTGTIVLALLSITAPADADESPWRAVIPGVESGVFDSAASGGLHVVRVDPRRARLRAVMASAHGRKARTAGAWCDSEHLAAAINLGMFLDDGLANVGYARDGGHINHPRWVKSYHSALVIGPRKAGLPAAAIVDVDSAEDRLRLDDYETVVQNLRLIRAPGRGAWGSQSRRWSEAAIAMDRAGRILFVHSRAPHSMAEFNRLLLALPLDVVTAMHVEGGPEASLSVRGPLHVDLNGSFETGFNENDAVSEQWPIPNVLGVEALPAR